MRDQPREFLEVEDMAVEPGRKEHLSQGEDHRLPVYLFVHVGDKHDALTELCRSFEQAQRVDPSSHLRRIGFERRDRRITLDPLASEEGLNQKQIHRLWR